MLEIIPQGTANLQRSAYITFGLAGRGQRNSDTPYAAMFPGLLTDGIHNAQSYIFRGIVADAVRGLEFLLTRPELDPSRVVVFGNDLALITAALSQGATHVVTTPALFYHAAELAPQTQAYPLEEINDYGRMFPAPSNHGAANPGLLRSAGLCATGDSENADHRRRAGLATRQADARAARGKPWPGRQRCTTQRNRVIGMVFTRSLGWRSSAASEM